MRDSSDRSPADFTELSVSNIEVMLRCLSGLRLLETELLEQTYSRHATGFGNVLDFLLSCGLVSRLDNKLTPGRRLARVLASLQQTREPQQVIRSLCLDVLLNGSNAYSRAVFALLSHFTIIQGTLKYYPETRERIAVAALRNFLMDLEILTLDQGDGAYILQTEAIDMMGHVSAPLSPQVLEAMNRARIEVGLEAERLVIEMEKLRLAAIPGLVDRIVHVSQTVVNAGYDIESYEVTHDASGDFTPRYIEVKTFKAGSPAFYWSRNEIDTARELGVTYWLYLVPRNNLGFFDKAGVQHVQNPFRLFADPDGWEISADTYRFRRKD